MTATNPKDFLTFLDLIPKENKKNVWFFPIKQDRKNPDVLTGTILKGNLEYRLSRYAAEKRLKWGKNVGIYALTGGIMFLDLDVENGKQKASTEFLDHINKNPTLTIKTRNGGLQYYYINDGLYDNQVIKENNINIGELRTDWYYVVSVGSYVTPDEHNFDGTGTYTILEKNPIRPFLGHPCILKRDDVKIDYTDISYKSRSIPISPEKFKSILKNKNRVKI